MPWTANDEVNEHEAASSQRVLYLPSSQFEGYIALNVLRLINLKNKIKLLEMRFKRKSRELPRAPIIRRY